MTNLRKGHRRFREPWKKGQRRARDALPAVQQARKFFFEGIYSFCFCFLVLVGICRGVLVLVVLGVLVVGLKVFFGLAVGLNFRGLDCWTSMGCRFQCWTLGIHV